MQVDVEVSDHIATPAAKVAKGLRHLKALLEADR